MGYTDEKLSLRQSSDRKRNKGTITARHSLPKRNAICGILKSLETASQMKAAIIHEQRNQYRLCKGDQAGREKPARRWNSIGFVLRRNGDSIPKSESSRARKRSQPHADSIASDAPAGRLLSHTTIIRRSCPATLRRRCAFGIRKVIVAKAALPGAVDSCGARVKSPY